MSNVEYQCPKCRSRLFAPPGGTPHHCPNHPELKYEQTEFTHAPNFQFKDEGDNDPNKTGVLTPGVSYNSVSTVNVKVEPQDMTEEELLVYYREMYGRLSNTRPDMRWGVNRLKEECEAWEATHTPPPAETDDETGEEAESTEEVDANA